MRLLDGDRLYAASDLVDYVACAHLAALKLSRLEGRIEAPPPRVASTADLASSKGGEHEELLLSGFVNQYGDELVRIESGAEVAEVAEAASQTQAAMRAGAPMIYQATFLEPPWTGHADFLERVELSSGLGSWSYIPIDAKLARSVKPYFVIQLCSYAELIGEIQGEPPPQMDLILGDERRHSFLFSEFRSYFERMKSRFLDALAEEPGATYPDPVPHCEVCEWAKPCEERRVADDHLSQVANLGGYQARRFALAGVSTVEELAAAEPDSRPLGMSRETFERLHSQATLQLEERVSEERTVVLLEPEAPGEGESPRGFGLQPPPSEGDLFFDIEGDPFYDDGLEYLWGVSYLEDGEMRFRAFWGLDHDSEKRALEDFVDFVFQRRDRFPDLHVYHYAPYERTALGRLMGRHATREEEVDRLFREQVLVDLFRVVEQSMQISRPSYSLKEVERFYQPDREAEVKQAGDSVLLFEQWREEQDQTSLEKIEAYNKEDCDSTLRLRAWLLEQKAECESRFAVEIPWRALGESEEIKPDAAGLAAETALLQTELLDGLPDNAALRTAAEEQLWLLAQLLDYHRREAKPGYWEFFDRLQRSDLELLEADSESIAGLQRHGDPEPLLPPSKSSLQRFNFPPQEHKIGLGKYADPHSCGIDPATGESDRKPKKVEVRAISDQEGMLELKLSGARLAEEQRALIPPEPYSTPLQRATLRDFAREVIDHGLDGVARFEAARDLLVGAAPRTATPRADGLLQGQSPDWQSIGDLAAELQQSYLFIQGPPGSGKTYTGAKVIIELIKAGSRVGVSANSHKAINNLLAEVEEQAIASDASLRGLKKFTDPDQEFAAVGEEPERALIGNSKKNSDFESGDYDLMAGTAWLWCREEMRESLDYLVIDEAGQISLADAIAMATSARNVILLGDPLQLGQVSQGTHPQGSGCSVLEHLLAEHGTIPAELGVFLEETRRMHPDVCRFVSEAIYEGRLRWEASCERQSVEAAGSLSGTGVRSIPVPHTGNSRQSPEEAEVIAGEISSLAGASFTNRDGETSELRQSQIMVVSPYNAQVRCLRECLDKHGLGDVAVGTVDKFQGQEAAVVFFSMATSSGAQVPRNVEFLYSRNRLNVAISRAQCLAVLVASPDLMAIDCRNVEQMRLVNALCLLDSIAGDAGAENQEAASGTV
jgi:predicted RecB family nuclease